MTHMNDLNLKYYKDILNEERTKIEKNIRLIESDVNSIDDIDIKEVIYHLKNKLSNIDDALDRIKGGSYGILPAYIKPL